MITLHLPFNTLKKFYASVNISFFFFANRPWSSRHWKDTNRKGS